MKPWKSPWFCSINRWPQSATWSTQQVAHWAPGKDPWRFGTSKVWWYICIVYVCDNENNLCIYIIYYYILHHIIYTHYIYILYIYIHYKYIQIYRYTWLYDIICMYSSRHLKLPIHLFHMRWNPWKIRCSWLSWTSWKMSSKRPSPMIWAGNSLTIRSLQWAWGRGKKQLPKKSETFPAA